MKKLNIRQFGIGSLIKYPPLISSDSKYLFTIGDDCVYVWTVSTGQCLRLINENLDSKEQTNIVSICINPFNRLQLCVGEQNGNINIWDYEDGILIHTIELNMEIVEMKSIATKSLFVFVKNNKNYSLINYGSVRPKSSSEMKCEKLPCLPKSISFDLKGEYCVFMNGEGTIVYLFNLIANQLKSVVLTKQNLSFHQKITCVEIHPHGQCLALGTQSGRIALWYSFLNKEIQMSYLHWHSLSVNCLSFSFDGSYLLSGGNECVLVKWILNKNEPTFLPRLGSSLIYLTSSQDQTFYVSTHVDNCVHVIGSHFIIQQTISAVNQIQQNSNGETGIHLFAREKSIVMNKMKPGYLQFMSIDNGKLLYNLDVVGENYVSPNESNEEYLYTDIKELAIDSTETWLVTFEQRTSNDSNEDLQNERKLRFWFYNSNKNEFELNTTIEYPHGQQTLNQMIFHPKKCELITSGNDGFIKIWTLIEQNQELTRSWRCLSVHSHRSYSSCALTFAFDKETNSFDLCCSFEHLVTIWKNNQTNFNDESDYEYKYCLAHFDKNDFVKHLTYCQNQLIVCHSKLINFWNLTTKEFVKSLPWNVSTFAKHPTQDLIVFFDKNFLHLYSFIDGKCHTRKSSSFRNVQSALFVPNEKPSTIFPFGNYKLIFYLPKQGLKTFVEQNDEKEMFEENRSNENQENLLRKLINQSQQDQHQHSKQIVKSFENLNQLNQIQNHLNEQLLSTPAYLLPSIQTYSIQSLKNMLLPSFNQLSQQQVPSKDEEIEENLSTMSID